MKRIFKIISLLIAAAIVFSLVGCTINKNKIEVALVTDVGDIDDRSYNQEAYLGIKKYCEEKNVKYKYFRPKYKETKDILDSINKAVKMGAKIVVCPNEIQAKAVETAQKKYPKVKFLFLNGNLKNLCNNTYEVNFSELELGFLAGYTAVIEGYRNLGFQGNAKSTKSENYGFGFIQGAGYAAMELNLSVGEVNIKYNYASPKSLVTDTQVRNELWFNSGTQVIFTCGRKTLAGTISVAESAPNRWIIGNEVDKSKLSGTVITSSKKLIADVVYSSLDDFYKNKFKGGEHAVLGCKDNAITIELANGKLKNFNYKNLQHIKYVLSNNVNDINTYMISSDQVKDFEIESTSDFAVLFPVKSIIVDYITN